MGQPHHDAEGQDALDGRGIECQQQLLTIVIFPEHFSEVQMLLRLLDDSRAVADQKRLAEIKVPRKLKVWTLPTQSLCMKRGYRSYWCVLKSRMISLVFVVFRDRLFTKYHPYLGRPSKVRFM